MKRGQGFEGKVAKSIDEVNSDNEQIKFRKDMLSKYLVKLVTEYDENFVDYIDWVGKIHVDSPGKVFILLILFFKS